MGRSAFKHDAKAHPKHWKPAASEASQTMSRLLAEHGLTQEDLGAAVGLSAMEASRLLRGTKRITVDLAFRLDRFFGIDAEQWIRWQSFHDLHNLNPDYVKEIRVAIPTIQAYAKKKHMQNCG